MTWLEIRPQDVWLFRDGKPFAAGEDRSAHSMFPPSPLTLQGALRQKISVSSGISLAEYKKPNSDKAREVVEYIGKHGELEDMGKFTMQGPFLSLRRGEEFVPLFPTPADLLKNTESHEFYISKPSKAETWHSDLQGGFAFPDVKADHENLPGYWMAQEAFEQYLTGGTLKPALYYHNAEDDDTHDKLGEAYKIGQRIFPGNLIYQSDYRFGVSTNALTSFREEGQLYQVQFIRPQPGISLLTHISDEIPTHLLEGPLNLGGEQRQAQAAKVTSSIAMPAHPFSKHFKVIFLTPAYFKEGWRPEGEDQNWSAVLGHDVTLKSAVLYRPLKIGGWNSAANRARSMHNYVAPGSVYYFEAKTEFSLPPVITQNPTGMNAEALGFGQYAVGQW